MGNSWSASYTATRILSRPANGRSQAGGAHAVRTALGPRQILRRMCSETWSFGRERRSSKWERATASHAQRHRQDKLSVLIAPIDPLKPGALCLAGQIRTSQVPARMSPEGERSCTGECYKFHSLYSSSVWIRGALSGPAERAIRNAQLWKCSIFLRQIDRSSLHGGTSTHRF